MDYNHNQTDSPFQNGQSNLPGDCQPDGQPEKPADRQLDGQPEKPADCQSERQPESPQGYWLNGQPQGYYIPPYRPEPKNNFATAAMILGIASLVSLCTVFLPIPLGALGILFVVLGKRHGKKLPSTAITGLITSLIGIACGLLILISTISAALNMLKPENREQLNQMFEQTYGMDFDEYYEEYMKQLEELY